MRKKHILFLLTVVMALLLVACGGSDEPADEPAAGSGGDVAAGEPLFQSTCAACHGADAKGLPALGKDLTSSEFFQGSSNEELLAFILIGRDANDPENTTGVAMLPKGGNPALTNDDILDIIAYVRTIP
jgi:mono/diheme cytochrome c family protein